MNNSFLSTLINQYISIEEQQFAAIFFKDRSHRYQYLNDNLFSIMKNYIDKPLSKSDIINKQDTAIYPIESANFFVEYDQLVYQSGKAIEKYEEFKINAKQKVYAIAIKYPIYQDGKLIGLLGKTRYLNLFNINGNQIILSKRELDILVQLTFGISLKEIGRLLNLKVSTVSTYIQRVRAKLNIKSQLDIVKLISSHVLSTYVVDHLFKLNNECL